MFSAMTETDAPIFDRAKLVVFLPEIDTDPAEAVEEIDFFLDQLSKMRAVIEAAVSAEDWAAADEQVHKLGSGSAMFGLMRLSVACRSAERAFREGGAAASKPIIESLLSHINDDAAALAAAKP
jgi:HPt (histidine-containing phosphotransfer) domain-containing protein